MSTKKSTYSQAEWLKAYRERFAERARGESGEVLTEAQLDSILDTGVPFDELSCYYEDDPEGAADEEMSCWD